MSPSQWSGAMLEKNPRTSGVEGGTESISRGHNNLSTNRDGLPCASTESKTCVVNEVEVDVFLEFPFFFYGPVDVGNLISGSSAFSEPSLYIWKFLVPVLLNPSVKDFEHNFTSI